MRSLRKEYLKRLVRLEGIYPGPATPFTVRVMTVDGSGATLRSSAFTGSLGGRELWAVEGSAGMPGPGVDEPSVEVLTVIVVDAPPVLAVDPGGEAQPAKGVERERLLREIARLQARRQALIEAQEKRR